MSMTRDAWELMYQTNPILLNGGVMGNSNIPLPIGSLLSLSTSGISSVLSLLGNGAPIAVNQIAFRPAPGTALFQAQNPTYPTADIRTAANASVLLPAQVTMIMDIPAQGAGGYEVKSAAMSLLKAILNNHQREGGTFTVIHPAYIYTGCLLNQLVDITGRGNQPAVTWQWTFDQPLTTQPSPLGDFLNGTMSAITNGAQDLSGALGTLVDNVGNVLQSMF
ncbi:hypothetical protein [Burkholderia multivorans]|uniref:hypothetical protein n=1 Tax=Burkholderia multivorans TaxID=87883 RepID=UPI001C24FEF7|nr:hypothetical protein [Burkholderia multivorans]MBU9297544.1 hypothetical protein [Burkholderia multivorans]MBU9523597.1 hypothetical protein [Burkholderia multivorans]